MKRAYFYAIASVFAATSMIACAAADTGNSGTDSHKGASQDDQTEAVDPPTQAKTPPRLDAAAPPATPPVAKCTATTCATGCCMNDMCFTDHTVTHCGSAGVACPAACTRDQVCAADPVKGFACGAAPPVKVDVVLASAKVVGSDTDIYVNTGHFATFSLPRTDTVSNSDSPVWNVVLGSAMTNELVGATVDVEVKDDVRFGSDRLVGTCTYTVTAADVAAKQVLIQRGLGCNGNVYDVLFQLKPSM